MRTSSTDKVPKRPWSYNDGAHGELFLPAFLPETSSVRHPEAT